MSKTDGKRRGRRKVLAALDYQAEKYGGRSERTREGLILSTSSSSTSPSTTDVFSAVIRSRELEKCEEWVKLQTVSNEFSKFLTEHPEASVVALEQILVQWSCVHVGDAFEVDFSGFVSSREDEDEYENVYFKSKISVES